MKRLILIFVSIFSIVFASQANVYTVNSNADANAGTGLTGDLRYCINQAAGSAVGLPHTIIFSTAMTITINSDLQINTGNHNGITINGFVDGTDGPDVIIRSSGTLNNQMVLNGTVGAKIYGLVFQNLDYGIHLNGATTTVIKGCYFGTNAAGTAIVNGINQAGVYVQNGGTTANNIIGGLLTNLTTGDGLSSNNSERCIFAGCAQKTNAGAGVRVPALLVTNAGGTQVINNYFGIDATGTVKLGNGNQTTTMPLAHSNIYMNNAINSVIDRNVIAGATGSGIHLENWCNNTKIKGNKIGTNAAGTAAYNGTTPSLSFSNEAAGIFIQSGTGLVIGYDGGTIANERNIISGNGGAKHNNWQQTCDAGFSDYNQFGIYTESLGNSTIKGNYIGTDITGNSSGTNNVFGNRAGGIKMVSVNGVGSGTSQNNIIGGGTTANDRNIISGNGYLWKANDNTSTCNGGSPSPSGMVSGPGLLLQYANTSSNTVSGNYIGLGADGLTSLGNNANGVEIQGAASNNIGTPGVPNYICNNTWGVFLQVDFGATYVPAANNTIAGNVIGLTPTNTVAGNGVRVGLTEGGGIGMQMGVNGTKIGTAVANGGNVISGNSLGISIQTNSVTAGATAPSGNIIYNNIIGLDPTGTVAKPNTSFGVSITMGGQGTVFPFNNTIGGTGANQANTISSNQQSGVYISHTAAITPSTANSIVGNKIGTNAAGTGTFGNTLQGIEIVNVNKTNITSNTISNNSQNGISLTGTTTNTISTNTITANSVNGIYMTGSSSNTIQGNTISSNTSNGVYLTSASASNIIGGIVAGEANTINTNGGNGVVVDGATSLTNSIHQNSFSCNTLRGIVLSNGGNNNIKTATLTGSTTQLTYTNPNAFATRIEIFETDGCATCPADPTRLQGKTFVTSGNLTAGGTFTFTVGLGYSSSKLYTAILHQGGSITTTAARNTSEFTACYTLCSNPTPGITGTTTLCEGTASTTFTVSPITSGSTYTWSYPTGVTPSGSTTSSSLTVAIGAAPITGNITVTETVTGGCVGSGSVALTIKAKPTGVSAGTTQNLCSATSVSLTGSTLPSGTTGLWTVSPSGPTFGNSGNASTTASGLVAGTNYTFTWAVTNAPCAAVSATSTVNNPIKPTPSLVGTTILCEGTPSATFNTASVSGNNYSWTYPAGVTPSGSTTSSSITVGIGAAPITGSISVTETSSASCSTTASAALTIKAKPTNVSAGADQNLCASATVSLTGSTLPSGATGAWTVSPSTGVSFNDATSATTTANGLTPATDYVFTWAITNAPCAPVSAPVTISNKPQPTTADAGANQSTCNTGIVTLGGNVPTVGTGAWTVSPSVGVTFDNAASPTATASGLTAGTPYTFTWTITNAPCAASTATATVDRTDLQTPTIDGGGGACSATTANLSIHTVNAGSTYVWDVLSGDATITSSTTANPITVSSGQTGGVIRVRETNGGCINIEATASITINPNNDPVAIGNDYSTCLGSTTLVGNVPVNGTGTWSVVTPSTATVSSTVGGVADASNLIDGNIYTFVYTISGACGPDQTDQVEVTAGLTGLAVTASGPTDTLCVNTNRNLSATVVGGSGDYTYVWVSSDGSFSSTGHSPNITVQPASGGETTYTVYVIDNVNIGCKTNTDDAKVNAVESQDLNIPNLITPNGDDKNEIFYLSDKTTGMGIIKEGSHIEVVNRWGSKVYEANNYENNWVPKDLTDGMYYYHITSSCGNKEYKSWLQILGNKNN